MTDRPRFRALLRTGSHAVALLTVGWLNACALPGASRSMALPLEIRAEEPRPLAMRSLRGSALPEEPELTRLPAEIASAIETRLTELVLRGGPCAEYARVMARSYRENRIRLRPYMWRVDGRLVSGQALPNGDMVLAREIDPLNPGVRTVDDVLWSVEHEAAHIAFRIANDEWAAPDAADRYVRSCRGTAQAPRVPSESSAR